MTWFKIDDSLAFNSKVVAAGVALTLWTRAGAWSAQQLSDGFIPDHMVPLLGGTKMARTLVEVGLWEVAEKGYRFHDWGAYQPLRVDVEELRRQRAEAGAKGGKASSSTSSASSAEASAQASASATSMHGASTENNPRPDPSRPIPSGTSTALFNAADATPNGRPRNAADSAAFDAFWAAYPRRQGKGEARKAWKDKRCESIADEVIAGAERYRDDPNRAENYTKMAAGWLRAERWSDDPLPMRAPQSRAEAEQQHTDAAFARAAERAAARDAEALVAINGHEHRAVGGAW